MDSQTGVPMPNFKNRPNRLVTTDTGEKVWDSRSVAVVVVPFFFVDDSIYLPLGLRGEHLPHAGKWGIPCGFLDWDETLLQACWREVYEEIGVDLFEYSTHYPSQPSFVISDPGDEGQVISCRFIFNLKVDTLPELTCDRYEVLDVRWIEIDLDKVWYDIDLAFNHKEIIHWASISLDRFRQQQTLSLIGADED